jgi:hypothetical protein
MLLKSVTDNVIANLKNLVQGFNNLGGKPDYKDAIKQLITAFVNASTTGSEVKGEIDDAMSINDYLSRDFPLKLSILEESVDSLNKKTIIARNHWINQVESMLKRMEENTKGKWKPLEQPEEYKKSTGRQENDSYLLINPLDVLAP